MPKQTIFLTGATGYIGGSILWRLLRHNDVKSFRIRALVRDVARAKRLADEFGVDTVVGNLSELRKLESLAAEADYVITTANIVDYSATKAILKGMKEHWKSTGKIPVLIQTSGTAILDDDAAGMFTGEKVYDDLKVEELEALPVSQPHREVDFAVISADKEGYARTYLVYPSTVYGIAKNGLTDAKLQNPVSIQVPQIIRAGLDRGQGGMVGLGKNMWPNVHIDDQADLYLTLFNRIRADPGSVPHGRDGIYFAETGEHRLHDVYRRVAEALVSLGKGKSPEPTTFTRKEFLKYFGDGPDFYGSNSRCTASRARSIGWKPSRNTSDFMASIRPEVEALVFRERKN